MKMWRSQGRERRREEGKKETEKREGGPKKEKKTPLGLFLFYVMSTNIQ
jgi:hypothetical protein